MIRDKGDEAVQIDVEYRELKFFSCQDYTLERASLSFLVLSAQIVTLRQISSALFSCVHIFTLS